MANVYVRSGAGGAGTGADWANAYVKLSTALAAKAAGDTFWVAADHSETQATALTMTPPGTISSSNKIQCAIHTGSVPPVPSDYRTTAIIATTVGSDIIIAGAYAQWAGILFNAGSGSSTAFIRFNNVSVGVNYFEDCKFTLNNTSASSQIVAGSATSNLSGQVIFGPGCSVKFGAVTQAMLGRNVEFIVRFNNAASFIDAAGSIPTAFLFGGATPAVLLFEGVDLSLPGAGKTLVQITTAVGLQRVKIKDCKLNAALGTRVAQTVIPGVVIELIRCSSGAVNNLNERYTAEGMLTTDFTVVRTGGADDDVPYSHKITTTANLAQFRPFEAFPLPVFNATTAADVTVKVEGIWNFTALPTIDEAWVDCEYLGASGTPLGSYKKSGAPAASTEAWDSLATARANSTAYAVGDIRKVASNSGRLFIVTAQSGNSAASEPGGFASAVDGGSVTDGGVTWRAMMRFKIETVLTSPQPGMTGAIYAYPKFAKVSTTYYLDPKVELS